MQVCLGRRPFFNINELATVRVPVVVSINTVFGLLAVYRTCDRPDSPIVRGLAAAVRGAGEPALIFVEGSGKS